MHEMSIVRSLLDQVHSVVDDPARNIVIGVSISIGPLSGVEPLLVKSAFEHLAAPAGLSEAKLEIVAVQLRARCLDCQQDFDVVDFVFECPACRRRNVRVIGGDEVRLLHVTVNERNHPVPLNQEAKT